MRQLLLEPTLLFYRKLSELSEHDGRVTTQASTVVVSYCYQHCILHVFMCAVRLESSRCIYQHHKHVAFE